MHSAADDCCVFGGQQSLRRNPRDHCQGVQFACQAIRECQTEETTFNCIFCKSDASGSRSVEHIVPAALGNRKRLLPPGVVCDRCNHYFGSKLEHAVLKSAYFNNLRSRQSLPSRRGNPIFGSSLLHLDGILVPVQFSRQAMSVLIEDKPLPSGETAFQKLADSSQAELIIPLGGREPDQRKFSRFLAKMALEATAEKVCHLPTYEEFLLHEEFDPIRNWARYGRGVAEWPFHVRRLYQEDRKFRASEEKDGFQVLFEYDFLLTTQQEVYFAICLFGVEFTINMGGPDIDGYEAWLKENEFRSPLYCGKNLDVFAHNPLMR